MKYDIQEVFSPKNRIDVILDSDVYNELDDYYAIAYMIGNSDRLNVKGVTIAPFPPIYNKKVKDVAEGVEVSAVETKKVFSMTKMNGFTDIYEGSKEFLKDEVTPVESEAVDFIIKTSKNYDENNRLYIIAIGAITNVASAIIKDPSIIDRIAVIWLGGNEYHLNAKEFNMEGDIAAARVVMSADLPFAQLPCAGVVSDFITENCELSYYLKGKSPLCDFLYENTVAVAKEFTDLPTWSRVIWDVVAVALMLNDQYRYMYTTVAKRRLPEYDTGKYEERELDLEELYVCKVRRDPLMYDLFNTLYNC